MTDLIPNEEDLLQSLATRAGLLLDAYDRSESAKGEHLETEQEFRAYEWGVAAGETEPDAEMEAAGATARAALSEAMRYYQERRRAYADALAVAVEHGAIRRGDEVMSPWTRETLRCAEAFLPAGEAMALGEITLTGDGNPIQHQWHSPKLIDGRPVEDDTPEVRFERWGSTGLRVAGYVHATSRGLLRVD